MKKIILLILLSISALGTSYAQNSKYEKVIEFSGLFETKQSLLKNVSALGLTFVNGYRTTDKLFIGGGIGVDYSTWQSLGYSSVYDDYSVSIPIFARAKVNLIDSKGV